MSKPKQEVNITRAKGRPMLTWVGKKPLVRATAYPAQAVEQFEVPAPDGALAEIDWSDVNADEPTPFSTLAGSLCWPHRF